MAQNTRRFKVYPIANGHVIWFCCPNFYGDATKYIKLHN